MRSWVPVPGTTKARLVDQALTEFGERGFAAVGVTELARGADVTIGSLYHHFGSKVGLYTVVREDVEQRVLDRMEGAAAIRPKDLGGVLLVAFDYLVRAGFARLLAEPHPERTADPVEAFLATLADRDGTPVSRLLIAAWRAALDAAADAMRDGQDPAPVRAALRGLIR
ncbi:TetR/AcrR family transcriptional regulator [Micromonospora sp. CPCC 206061]|uniref:TetR/AcrR family transcriptional regulator n=1 Tax=Micromonospora sp. CPCC 206061 TaxID=3122410 RepID=UPI002FF12BCE